MKNLLEHILIHLVEHPESIVIDESEENGQFIYRINLAPEDIGKVIGREGNVIQAIRTLAKVRAMKDNKLIGIFINEPQSL